LLAAVLPPTAPSKFIQRSSSAIGLLDDVVVDGTALPGVIISISSVSPMSAAALLLPLVTLLLLAPLLPLPMAAPPSMDISAMTASVLLFAALPIPIFAVLGFAGIIIGAPLQLQTDQSFAT
jgi:hypothetical protein